MKIFISVDMEGIAGIAHWDETDRNHRDYSYFQDELIREVRAACDGANNAGAKEIWVRDAHCTGRNLDFTKLPLNVKLVRAFAGNPFCMMQEIDKSFDAALMIGYHSYAGSDTSPLSHTMMLPTDVSYIKINGELISEFLINGYTASYVGVPVVFVSGDVGICEYAAKINPHIKAVGLKKGHGSSVISIHPEIAHISIKKGVEAALKTSFSKCLIKLPKKFEIEISFVNHTKAYRSSFYPGIKKVSAKSLIFKTNDYYEVLRMMSFVL